MRVRKILLVLIFLAVTCEITYAASNSADAFMSLPWGHTFARTQKRMENSGATTLTPRKESLTMQGYFENYQATFIFGFYKNKLLNAKSVYLKSMGDSEMDRQFYEALRKAYNATYGSTGETPTASTRNSGKIALQNVWTPNRYETITLTYNPEASKRFPGKSLSDRVIQIIYKYDKWD